MAEEGFLRSRSLALPVLEGAAYEEGGGRVLFWLIFALFACPCTTLVVAAGSTQRSAAEVAQASKVKATFLSLSLSLSVARSLRWVKVTESSLFLSLSFSPSLSDEVREKGVKERESIGVIINFLGSLTLLRWLRRGRLHNCHQYINYKKLFKGKYRYIITKVGGLQ